MRFGKPKMKNKKNYKTNLNWTIKYLPWTLVGNTAINVNISREDMMIKGGPAIYNIYVILVTSLLKMF